MKLTDLDYRIQLLLLVRYKIQTAESTKGLSAVTKRIKVLCCNCLFSGSVKARKNSKLATEVYYGGNVRWKGISMFFCTNSSEPQLLPCRKG